MCCDIDFSCGQKTYLFSIALYINLQNKSIDSLYSLLILILMVLICLLNLCHCLFFQFGLVFICIPLVETDLSQGNPPLVKL